MSGSGVQTLLELCQTQCCDQFPEEPVPVPNNPVRKEAFPNIQPESPITASRCSLGPIPVKELSPCPSTHLMRELQADMRPPLSLFCSGLNNQSASCVLPCGAIAIFVALLWRLLNSF